MTTPEEFLAVRPEPKRDRWGRYIIPHPETGAEIGWTRATTFASSVADKFGIGKWQTRQAAVGLARRADLLAAVAAVADPDSRDGKRAIDALCEQAQEAAGANVRRTLGTALHSFTEAHDLGRAVAVPEPYDADVAAYAKAMTAAGAQIDRAHVERIVCLPEIGGSAEYVAGTFDRLVTIDGRLMVADLKTGADLGYAWGEIAIQLALYANASTMWDAEAGVHLPMPAVDKATAIVMHLPVGENRCTLHEVDIAAGWAMAVECCTSVRAWRKRRDLARPLAATEVIPEPEDLAEEAVTEAAARIEVLRGLPGGLDALRQRWPESVLTPKKMAPGQAWSDEDHATVLAALTYAEAKVRAPFPGEDSPIPPSRNAEAVKTPTPPALAELEDGPPSDALPDLVIEVNTLPGEATILIGSWAAEGLQQHRQWKAPDGTFHARHEAIIRAAIACARYLYDDDDPSALTRAALAYVMGEDVQPTWRTGAVLGSLTIDQAQRLAQASEAFAASDPEVTAAIGAALVTAA